MTLRLLSILLLLGIAREAGAQTAAPRENKAQQIADTGVYRAVNNRAIFPENWQQYMNASLTFPQEFKSDSVSIKITVEFIIEKNGSLSRARAIRSEGHINGIKANAAQLKPFADESIRVVLAAPAWKAAMNQGQIVRSYFTMPIVFRTN